MTIVNQLKPAEVARVFPAKPSQPTSRLASGIKRVFVGRNGVRAGWRLLIFAALVVVLLGGFLVTRNGGVQGFQEARSQAAQVTVTPLLMCGSEGVAFLLLCVATLIISKIEHRKLGEYGLPLRRALGKDLGHGCLWGFLAISGTLLTMFLLRGFRITGLALHGTAIFFSMAAWGIAFFVVGLCEEFMLRGYAQYTLASGIGFWPAAFVMSGLFAFGHFFNTKRNWSGCSGNWAVRSSLLPVFATDWEPLDCGRLSCSVGLGADFLRRSGQWHVALPQRVPFRV